MSLIAHIVLRLALVAMLSFLATLTWVLVETGDRLREEATVTAERVARRWEARPGLGSIEVTSSAAIVGAEAVAGGALVLPGVCVTISAVWEGERRICNARERLGGPAPGWFVALFERVYAVDAPVTREVTFRRRVLGTVTATLDRNAAAERAWRDIGVLLGLAAAMALGMTILGGLAVARTLAPAGRIVAALRDLEGGTEVRLPAFASAEFARIAAAFNDLVARLRRTTEERTALTRRLFEVQENERRLLARELHDEFGQCLAASSAMAASIASGAPPERDDLADDARAITGLNRRMQSVLKGALARLRVPDLEDLGLEASLRSLVGSWNGHRTGRTRFLLHTEGDLAAVAPAESLGLYRVVQECLTNATRHGAPSRVVVRVVRGPEPDAPVTVTVEDDGGGSPEAVAAGAGFGILGMRERIAALGGRLAIGAAAGGLSVSAIVPSRREVPA